MSWTPRIPWSLPKRRWVTDHEWKALRSQPKRIGDVVLRVRDLKKGTLWEPFGACWSPYKLDVVSQLGRCWSFPPEQTLVLRGRSCPTFLHCSVGIAVLLWPGARCRCFWRCVNKLWDIFRLDMVDAPVTGSSSAELATRLGVCQHPVPLELSFDWQSVFPQQRKLMGSSAQNSSGVHWCRRRVRFNEVRFRRRSGRLWCRARSGSTGFRRRFRRRSGRLWCRGQVPQGSGEGSGEGSRKVPQGSGEGCGEGSKEALKQSQVRFSRVPEKVSEKVPEKVWEALVQSQVRFNRVPEKVPEKVSGSLGAKPSQVQQVLEKVPEKVPRCFGGRPRSTGFRRKFRGFGARARSGSTGFRRRFRRRSGRLWCRARSGSAGFRRRFRRRLREALVQRSGSAGFRRRFQEALVQSQDKPGQVQQVLEKVPEKVWEALVQSQVRFKRRFRRRSGRLWCRARSGSTGFWRRFRRRFWRRFQEALVQNQAKLNGFRRRLQKPSQVRFIYFMETQRLALQHASERFVKYNKPLRLLGIPPKLILWHFGFDFLSRLWYLPSGWKHLGNQQPLEKTESWFSSVASTSRIVQVRHCVHQMAIRLCILQTAAGELVGIASAGLFVGNSYIYKVKGVQHNCAIQTCAL